MGLDTGKPILKQGILELQKEMMSKDTDAMEHFAERLATLIYDFVKSGEVEINKGIQVATKGTATAQQGQTTTKGNGIIK